mgnify:FL=1
MNPTRSSITADMLRDWQKRGVTIQQAAAEAGLRRNTIADQERRHGITLPRAIAQRGSKGPICDRKRRIISAADDTRVAAWSCAPEAIMRALERVGK